MSNPINDLRDFLSMSPSVVFPQDVLEYLPAIEAENAKLRELATLMYTYHHGDCYSCKWHDECCNELVEWKCIAPERIDEMAFELGIKV